MKNLKQLTISLATLMIVSACDKALFINNSSILNSQRSINSVKSTSESGLNRVRNSFFAKAFKKADRNNDKYLNFAEFNSNHSEEEDPIMFYKFKKLDTNTDQKLSLKELLFGKHLFPSAFPSKIALRKMAQELFNHRDYNHNNFVEKSELSSSSSGLDEYELMLLDIFDKNNDQQLSFSEFEDAIYVTIEFPGREFVNYLKRKVFK